MRSRRAPRGTEVGAAPRAPLTERLLVRLPGPRTAGVAAWALVPWVNLAAVSGLDPSLWGRGVPWGEVLNRVAASFAVVLSLWGVSRIDEELYRLRPALTHVVAETEPDVARLFRGIDSAALPLLLTAGVGVVLPLDEALRGDGAAAAVQGLTWLVIGVPLCTAVWVYVVLQRGLMRLGRGHVTLLGYRGDRSLGLRPVGRLAFTGFWLLFGAIGPLVLTGLTDVPVAAVGIGALVAALCLFFLSLRGIHRQMVAVKQQELALALALYRQALDRVRTEPTLEVLQQQSGLLGAAENLEKRAERILEWPFDESTLARVLTIASSAAAGIIARLVLVPTGI